MSRKNTYHEISSEKYTILLKKRPNGRYYIDWWYRDPESDRKIRMNPHIGKINSRTKDDKERLRIFKLTMTMMADQMDNGFNPLTGDVTKRENKAQGMSVENAFIFMLKEKTPTVGETTFTDYKNRAGVFERWLIKHGYKLMNIKEVTQVTANNFLSDMMHKSSVASRNNYKRTMSALFDVLVQRSIITVNPFKGIKSIKSEPKKHVPFTDEELKSIISYSKENDIWMYRMIIVFYYTIMRPVEVVKLQVKNIDFKKKLIHLDSKTDANIAPLIDIVAQELSFVKDYEPDDFIFTPNDRPGKWDRSESGKRDYWSRRFKEKILLPLDITDKGKDFYSIRHNVCINLFHSLKSEGLNFYEATDRMMPHTRHKTKTALLKYLRGLGVDLPSDYGERIRI